MNIFFNTLAELTNDIVIYLSWDYKISYLNNKAQSLLEKSGDKLINKSLKKICLQNNIDFPIPSNIKKLLLKQSIVKKEGKKIQNDGITQDILWTICSISDQKTNNLMIVGQLVDKFKYPEDPLLSLDDIVSQIPISIYWKDKNGVYMGCNHYMRQMAGTNSIQDIIGKKDDDMPWKGMSQKTQETDKKIIENGKICTLEETGLLHDNTTKILLSTKSPLKAGQLHLKCNKCL